ncbi:Intraflagellar transport protein 74 [Phytophthora boehmeriae]|uniref:Intraflagellar transport protein 74 n=1 Tax=Phytophthora boehmeriae TaxID=109152 RepID=A0A8T1WU09_9STRA|nr:Intraflagellar transport protein 74 [Phytophthora boehmeriae]
MSGRPGTSSGQRPGTGAGGGPNGPAPVGGLPSARPGTGQNLNPITARPGTGQRGMLGSSAGGRPLTGRLGTGQQVPATPGQTAGYGISLNTEVNVSDRPVTQQGMMGMRVGSAGPGRQVQDASFFKGKLHSKTAEITSEIEKLQREIEQDAKDKAQYAQLERKYEALAVEVRDLEGQLADYNLAMDKMRSATDPAEIRQVQEQLHQRNAREAEDVDRVFILRQEQEKNVRRMDEEMAEIHGKHQEKINQLAPQKLKRYQELLQEHHQTEVEIEARSQELELVMHAIHQKEAELSSDRYRDEYEALERQVRRLQKERDAAADDAKTAQMDPAEARAVLLAKVKDDKSKMEALEGVLQESTAEKQELSKALADLQSDLDERASGSDPAHKYEALFAKDKEMTEFLEQFPAKKEAESQSQRAAQGVIVQLLEHISAGMAKEDKLPGTNAANLEEMRKDLTFKERQLESSVTTKQRLTMELQKRQAELDKVNTLDAKIALELSSLLQKMDTMTTDMAEFGKLDSLQEVHAQTKQHLLRLKKQYIGRRDAMRQQVTALSSQLENLVQEIASQETAKNMDALEQKLRHHEQNIFHLKEYIDSKSREVDYEHLKQDCFRTLQDLNTLHVAQQQRQQQLNLGLVGGL